MEAHFTFLGTLIKNGNLEKFLTGVIVCALMVAIGFLIKKKLSPDKLKDSLVPSAGPSLLSIADFFFEKFVAHYDSILGKNNRQHLPFCAAIFFFILFANLVSLVPGVAPATTTVYFTVGMACVVFFYFNYVAIKTQGMGGYLKHLCGPSVYLAVLMFSIEVVSLLLRILTLNLRLYWNINADHIVLGLFSDMIGGFAFPFYALGTFVSFMQAFIFTTLTMVYILLATQHEEEHH